MKYRSATDPILRAGFRQCPACGTAALPREAEWVSGVLILAVFEASCRHQKTVMMLIDPASVPPAGFDIARYTTGRRCAGRNRRGGPCRARARAGSDFCDHHAAAA